MVHPDAHASPVMLVSPPTSVGHTNGLDSLTVAAFATHFSGRDVQWKLVLYPNSTTALFTARPADGLSCTVTGTNVERAMESGGGIGGIFASIQSQ